MAIRPVTIRITSPANTSVCMKFVGSGYLQIIQLSQTAVHTEFHSSPRFFVRRDIMPVTYIYMSSRSSHPGFALIFVISWTGGTYNRRCQFPVEIGLRLQSPCRLQEIVIVSEPALSPSAVECFVAGPIRSKSEVGRRGQDKGSLAAFPRGIDQRHNGSTTVSDRRSIETLARAVRSGIWSLEALT